VKPCLSLAFRARTKAHICQCIALLGFAAVPKMMGPKENDQRRETAGEKLKAEQLWGKCHKGTAMPKG